MIKNYLIGNKTIKSERMIKNYLIGKDLKHMTFNHK